MSWPLSQDYNEAIQSPASNFTDPDLKRGEAVCNALGLPMPYSGNFADVYQMRCPDGSRWAVKCFTREALGLHERYQEISAHLKQAKLPFSVDFNYLEKGIRIGAKWYPVLKMQWVEGLTLNQFTGQYLDKPAMLEALLQLWAKMGKYLRAAEVGHCDLQHGNVLLVPGSTPNALALKLIDYDGMWVPGLAGKKSGEVGHPCYQHPQRLREGTYSLDVDRFPLLLVATAMRALKADKGLWAKYDNGDNMLFKESDLAAPVQSELFQELASLPDSGLVMLAAHVRAALKGNLESAPLLEDAMPDAKGLATPAPTRRSKLGGGPPSGTGLNKSGAQLAPAAAASVVAPPPKAEKTFAFDETAPDGASSAPSRTRAGTKSRTAKAKAGGVPVAAWVGGVAAVVVLAGVAGAFLLMRGSGSDKTPPLVQNKPVDTVPPGTQHVRPQPVSIDHGKEPPKPDGDPARPDKEGTESVVVVKPPAGEIDSDPSGPIGEVRRFEGHSDPIRKLSVSPDGKQLLTAGFDKTLRLWDVARGRELLKWEGPVGQKMSDIAFLPDGKRAISCCEDDKAVHLWDLTDGHEIRSLQGHAEGVWHLAVTADGRIAADSALFVWDVESGKELHRLEGNPRGVESLAFSRDGKLLLTGSSQGSIRLWNVETGKEVRRFAGHASLVMGVAFFPDGDLAVSCSEDKTVCVWQVADGREVRRYEGVNSSVWDLALSTDGRRVLTGNDDGTLRLWDARTGKELYRFPTGTQIVWTVAFSPDGQYAFAAGSQEKAVRMWRLPPADYVPSPTPYTTPVVKKPDTKPAAPDGDSLAAAEKEVKDLYKAEYAKKKKEDVLALADKLRQQGIDTKDKPATRFVLFRESRDLATRAGDFGRAGRAVDEMVKDFAVNGREMNVQAVEAAERSILAPVTLVHLAEAALPLAEEAEDADDYDMADRAIKAAGAAAHSASNSAMEKLTSAREAEIEALRKTWEPARAAAQTLATKPDDPDANQALGAFFCLDKGDWGRGLPLLAQCTDKTLKALAQADLDAVSDPAAQIDLAKTYLSQADGEPGPRKAQFLRRACFWFQKARAQLTGVSRTEVEKKIDEVEKNIPLIRPAIVCAIYGAHNDWQEVTDKVRTLLVQAKGLKPTVKADAGELGVPNHDDHEAKTLVIVYQVGGQTCLSLTSEQGTTTLPAAPGATDVDAARPGPGQELLLLAARYGAEGTYWDATTQLQHLVQGGSLPVQAEDNIVGGDPFKDRNKALLVVYRYGNRVRLSITAQHTGSVIGEAPPKP